MFSIHRRMPSTLGYIAFNMYNNHLHLYTASLVKTFKNPMGKKERVLATGATPDRPSAFPSRYLIPPPQIPQTPSHTEHS